ncbi:hypothetical protein ROS59_003786 [Enterobacter cloacae]|nr:hypothetical protein [Enterobacter cloacae]
MTNTTTKEIEYYQPITKRVKRFGESYRQSNAFKQQKRAANNINTHRQEAIHGRGYKLDVIYPLSLEKLEGLLNGEYVFNDWNELIKA